MKHVKVRNFRKTCRRIRQSNGITMRKEVRKTEVFYTRGDGDPTGEEFLKTIDAEHFKKTTSPEYDSIDWKNVRNIK